MAFDLEERAEVIAPKELAALREIVSRSTFGADLVSGKLRSDFTEDKEGQDLSLIEAIDAVNIKLALEGFNENEASAATESIYQTIMVAALSAGADLNAMQATIIRKAESAFIDSDAKKDGLIRKMEQLAPAEFAALKESYRKIGIAGKDFDDAVVLMVLSLSEQKKID